MKRHIRIITNNTPEKTAPIRGHLKLVSSNGSIVNKDFLKNHSPITTFESRINQSSVEDLCCIMKEIDENQNLSDSERIHLLKLLYRNRMEKTGRLMTVLSSVRKSS